MAIIFADDDEFIRDIAESVLGNLTEDILLAEDGVEAISHLDSRGGKVKLIILDLNMPKMDGLQTVKNIRAKGNKVTCVGFSAGTPHSPRRRR